MRDQDPSVADDIAVPGRATEVFASSPTVVPRRRLLRAVSGVAIGIVALAGLTACGGEEGDDEGDEEDDD